MKGETIIQIQGETRTQIQGKTIEYKYRVKLEY